jgi:uncharacterized membrane protein YecN with MAPEG domain
MAKICIKDVHPVASTSHFSAAKNLALALQLPQVAQRQIDRSGECSMTIPIIAAVAGAVLIILQAILMILVGMHRIRNRINLGMGDDPALERKIRRHGNLAENAALFIVVLALAEMTVVPNDVVQIIALVFIVGRILHAIALSTVAGSQGAETGKIFQALRAIGAFTTFGSFIALGGYLLASIF